jgi:hypothetical protein
VRLGTASMLSQPGGPFIALERLDLRKYASRPALARVLLDYMLYAEHDVRRATELAGLATVQCGYEVRGGGLGAAESGGGGDALQARLWACWHACLLLMPVLRKVTCRARYLNIYLFI